MLFQLKLHGLRYRLNLANRDELRLAAFTALNAGTCTPSLLEAALDAEDRLDEIGSAFEKTLQELGYDIS
jgi:inactivated superfamily I helicase